MGERSTIFLSISTNFFSFLADDSAVIVDTCLPSIVSSSNPVEVASGARSVTCESLTSTDRNVVRDWIGDKSRIRVPPMNSALNRDIPRAGSKLVKRELLSDNVSRFVRDAKGDASRSM